jgi:hypothetical protein
VYSKILGALRLRLDADVVQRNRPAAGGGRCERQVNRRTKLFVLTALTLWSFAAPAQAGQVWLSGIDPVVAADRQRIGMTAATDPGAANDFMDLFRPNAPWMKTSSKIQIFKVTTQFLHRSTDAQLSTVIADLRRAPTEIVDP